MQNSETNSLWFRAINRLMKTDQIFFFLRCEGSGSERDQV
jgi:hypothetical protein